MEPGPAIHSSSVVSVRSSFTTGSNRVTTILDSGHSAQVRGAHGDGTDGFDEGKSMTLIT